MGDCSIPAKEQERPKPTNDTGKVPSLTQEHPDPSQVSPGLCQPVCAGWRLWVRTVSSQGTCHPDSVNGGREGPDKHMLKQDIGKEGRT